MKEGEVVVLEFTSFDTVDYSWDDDKLEVRDGDGTILMGERSGECLPGKIWSRTNIVHLHFVTDEDTTQTGWSANWTASMPTGDHFVKNNFILPKWQDLSYIHSQEHGARHMIKEKQM